MNKPKDIREYLTEQSIIAYREYVIEQCAQVADSFVAGSDYWNAGTALAIAIRALKDKP